MKRGRLPLLWAECLNLCGGGSKYNFNFGVTMALSRRSQRNVVRLSLELEELTSNYNRGNLAGLSYKTELQSALGDNGFKEI